MGKIKDNASELLFTVGMNGISIPGLSGSFLSTYDMNSERFMFLDQSLFSDRMCSSKEINTLEHLK